MARLKAGKHEIRGDPRARELATCGTGANGRANNWLVEEAWSMARDKVTSGPKTGDDCRVRRRRPTRGTASSCTASRSNASSASSSGNGASSRPSCSTWKCRWIARAPQPVDDVADTLDYKRVAKRLIAFVEARISSWWRRWRIAPRCSILEEFSVEWVRLSVNKPGAIRAQQGRGRGSAAHARRSCDARSMTVLKPGHVRVFVAAGSNVEPEKNLARACAEIAHTWPDAHVLARLSQRGGGVRRAGFHQPRARILHARSRWMRSSRGCTPSRRNAAGRVTRPSGRRAPWISTCCCSAIAWRRLRSTPCRARTCSSGRTCWGRWPRSRRTSCIPPSSEPSASCGRRSIATGTR